MNRACWFDTSRMMCSGNIRYGVGRLHNRVPPAKTGDNLNDPDPSRNPTQTGDAQVAAICFWPVLQSHPEWGV